MSPRLALYFLGSPQLYLDNEPIPTERRKVVALLAYLAMERGQHRRESLSALLWPDYDQSKAFTNLRHTHWEIQQSIGKGWLNADREKTGLNERADIWLDVQQFESLLTQSRAQNDISLRIPLFVEATELYRNHFLTGLSLRDAPISMNGRLLNPRTCVANSRAYSPVFPRITAHSDRRRKPFLMRGG